MNKLIIPALVLSLPMVGVAHEGPHFDGKRLSEQVKELSSDAYEGRGPATAGEAKTIEYVVAQMKDAGVSPGGDLKDGKRSWTQAVPLLRSSIKGTPKLSISVDGKPMPLIQGEQISVRAAMDGSKQVKVTDVPMVFVGYGVNAPERNWNDYAGVDMKGKIAVALVNDPDFETGEGDFGGKAMTYYGRWTYKFEEAARQGALGLFVVHETAPASYGWNTVKNSNTNTMFDVVRENPGSVHPQIEAWIQRDLAVDLFKQAGLDFDALKKKAQQRGFKPVPLKGETFSADYAVDAEVITSYNIAGRIEGSKYPDETVIYSAHWDHLGVGKPDAEGDTIYNGAVDNATGTAALVEIARAYAHASKPERSIVFLNVTAEEKGLLGSEYYASKPLYPLATTVAVINMDALDPTGVARNFTTSGSAKSDLLDDLIAIGKANGMAYVTDPHPEAGSFFRSDHFPFAKRGVPALSFGSGNDLVEGGIVAGEAAGKDYVEKRYHQPADEFEESWTFAGMVHDLPMLYQLGSDLANSREWPSWGKDSEFRVIRDASSAQRK